MERIVDKFIVLLCCVPVLAFVGTGYASVSMLLVAVTCSFATEMLPHKAAPWAGLVLCALALAVPAGAAFVAAGAYDLARRSPAGGAVAAVPVAYALQQGALGPAAAGYSALLCAAAILLSWRCGRVLSMRSRSLLLEDELRERELTLAAKNRELLDAQDYEVRLATLAERARIAREIHDNVGHLLTRAAVQTEALRVVHAGEAVEGELEGVADTLREALDEVRASVHNLRDEAVDLSVQIRAVVERACEGTGVETNVLVEAGAAPAPVAACLTAVAREAVSNTLRHAGASHVRAELIEHPGFWRLTVSDDGAGAEGAVPGAGMGLASMEERVRALDGMFRAGPGERGGWTVFASIPKEKEGERK